MRRGDREKWVVLVSAGAAGALILLATAFALYRQDQRRRMEEAWRAAQAAHVEPAAVEEDPYADRGDDAIAAVQRLAVDATTIGARVDSGELTRRVLALARPGVEQLGWRSQRLARHSVYAVSYVYKLHAVEFGPRWYVQLDPNGPRPEGSQGVVAVNGLAQQLAKSDPDDGLRYLNRADEVLTALTEHRFEGGLRLGSALLVYFEGRADSDDREILGWHVVPEATNPQHDLLYRAYFQWRERGQAHDAWWEVNLTKRDFRAKDLQANEIMARAASDEAAPAVDIRPRTLDLAVAPASETDPRRRAFRYLLANDRLVEAVSTLLSHRARGGGFSYNGWQLEVTDERHIYEVACRFNQGGTDSTVMWRVDAMTGRAEPVGEIATTARLVLEQVDAAAP